MYVCMYMQVDAMGGVVCMYMYMYTYMYVCVYLGTYVYVYVCVCTNQVTANQSHLGSIRRASTSLEWGSCLAYVDRTDVVYPLGCVGSWNVCMYTPRVGLCVRMYTSGVWIQYV